MNELERIPKYSKCGQARERQRTLRDSVTRCTQSDMSNSVARAAPLSPALSLVDARLGWSHVEPCLVPPLELALS
eukprot:scaffold129297_cov29-Tisochrysis_lutea.AAC.2